MEDKPDYQRMLEKLCQAGDPRKTLEWAQGDPDYVKQFGLEPKHIPALIDIAKKWVEDDEQVDDDIFYAPVHAWRALGQLRAVESAEVIEQAYVAGVVDEGIVGDWADVRKELGVEGLGLVPEQKKPLRNMRPMPAFFGGIT